DVTQHSIQLVELQLIDVHVAEKIARKGLEVLGGFHQPLEHRVRVDLEHAGRGTDAQALSQAREHAYDQFDRQAIAMQERAVRLQKVSLTSATVQLAPRATAWMAVSAEVPQP